MIRITFKNEFLIDFKSLFGDFPMPWLLYIHVFTEMQPLTVAQYFMGCCIPISDFAVAGPAAWNSLSDNLRYPVPRRLLKTRLFSEYIERIRGITHYILYTFTIYLLITYLTRFDETSKLQSSKRARFHSLVCPLGMLSPTTLYCSF